MRTPANIAGHPIHPMLVTIPIGLWIFSLIADLVGMRSANAQTWSTVAFYAMVGGIIGALAAALPGLIDLLSLKDRDIKKTALIHMSINLTVVALYAINAWTRYNNSVTDRVSLMLSILAVAMLAVSGWLGGKMVFSPASVSTPNRRWLLPARRPGAEPPTGERQRHRRRQVDRADGAMRGRWPMIPSDRRANAKTALPRPHVTQPHRPATRKAESSGSRRARCRAMRRRACSCRLSASSEGEGST